MLRPTLINTSRLLLVSLIMDAILGETTANGRRQNLREMTEDLDLQHVYSATLKQIKEQGGEKTRLGIAALMWLSHSERPLQPDELSHALAVEIGSRNLNPERIPSVKALLSSCLGLIFIDRETSTVRLIHFSLWEYLHACPNLFGPTHSIMAETCLTYLNFWAIKDISQTLPALPQSTLFLNYSSFYWGVHAKKESSKDVVSLAFQILSQIESHISTRLLVADLISRTGRHSHDIPINGPLVGFTGLHCASVFGITEVAASLMSQPNCDLSGRDFLGITPLIWAAICGQEEVAKLLLEQPTVTLDKPDGYFRRTALSWAAKMGHEGIVRLLLERATAKADGTDGWWGKTPRVLNVVRGRRYVNPNWLDKCGQTPLLLATEEGHEGVVTLLLGRKDVRSDKQDSEGRTPLCCAAMNGHGGVARILLERGGVNPNKPDNGGRTPLYCATLNAHEGVVTILLERGDIDPNKPDNGGRTPLYCATLNAHEGVVTILLGRGDIDPNKRDKCRRTPLCCAAMGGYERIVKILLRRYDISPDKKDDYGRTPLLWAARNGHEGVVRTLLERKDVSTYTSDYRWYQTQLWHANQHGHAGVAALLQSRVAR